MRILVTFAVDAEFAPWRKRHDFECQLINATRISKRLMSYQAEVQGVVVDVFLTGIGWENSIYNAAREGLRVLFDAHPDLCLTTGLAGGLKPELELGSVVAATEAGVQDGDATVKSNQYALAVAGNCGAKIAHRLITCDHVVENSVTKQAMSGFADLVDMESYFIMAMASGARVPAIAARAISDGVSDDLPIDFNKVTDRQGHLRFGRLVRELAAKPGRIPALVAFGRQSRKAASNLADFLDRFVLSLGRDEGRVAAAGYGEPARI